MTITNEQIKSWLNITENYLKRQEKNATNELIKKIWATELMDFTDWKSELLKKNETKK